MYFPVIKIVITHEYMKEKKKTGEIQRFVIKLIVLDLVSFLLLNMCCGYVNCHHWGKVHGNSVLFLELLRCLTLFQNKKFKKAQLYPCHLISYSIICQKDFL